MTVLPVSCDIYFITVLFLFTQNYSCLYHNNQVSSYHPSVVRFPFITLPVLIMQCHICNHDSTVMNASILSKRACEPVYCVNMVKRKEIRHHCVKQCLVTSQSFSGISDTGLYSFHSNLKGSIYCNRYELLFN